MNEKPGHLYEISDLDFVFISDDGGAIIFYNGDALISTGNVKADINRKWGEPITLQLQNPPKES